MSWKCPYCGDEVAGEVVETVLEHIKTCGGLRQAAAKAIGSVGAAKTNAMMTPDARHWRAVKAVRQREKNRAKRKKKAGPTCKQTT